MLDMVFIFVMVFTGVMTVATSMYKPVKPTPAPCQERIKDQLAWHKNVGTIWNG